MTARLDNVDLELAFDEFKKHIDENEFCSMNWFSLSDYEKYCTNMHFGSPEINYTWPNTKHDIWSVWLSLGLIAPLHGEEFYDVSKHQPTLYKFPVFDDV